MATYINREELAQFVEALCEGGYPPTLAANISSHHYRQKIMMEVVKQLLDRIAATPESDIAEAWSRLLSDATEAAENERCPGCGNAPGDGINDSCNHPEGCGYWKENESDASRPSCPGCGGNGHEHAPGCDYAV